MEAVNLPGDPDVSMLDQVPWIELSHAYGAAVDVPEQVRALVSADQESRGGLLWSFTSNLFHQGSVYPATVAVIPVFQQLLRYRSVTEKPLILELLANFALGYPEDLDHVELNDFVGHSDEHSPSGDDNGRDCYLGVAAGMPLYEALLQDQDPRTVVSSCYLMAFFPAHAWGSCPALLRVAADDRQADSVRSSALIACSYLDAGAVAGQFDDLLSDLLAANDCEPAAPVPLLLATAAYCALRTGNTSLDESLRSTAQVIAEQVLQYDVVLPDDGVYGRPAELDADDLAGYSQQVLNPDAAFPWGDLVSRLAKVTGKESAALKARRERQLKQRERKRLDPSIHKVKPNVFDRDNVLAAMRRMHAWLDVDRNEIPQDVLDEFEPFKPHIVLVWDEVLKLLDSDDRFISTAAKSLVDRAEPLSETAVNSLIDRLHDGDTRLADVLKRHSLTWQQRQEMCDRLVSGRFEPGFGHNQCTYREIVCEQGTDEQVWQLFDQGQGDDRGWACSELIRRKLLEEHDPRVYDVTATDCMSRDPGRYFTARFSFAKSDGHQSWFLSNYADLEPARRWAVVEAMELFRADLTSHEDALRTRIAREESPLLKAKMIRLMGRFNPVTPERLQRVSWLLNEAARPIERSAVVTTLGNWLGRGLDDRIIPELLRLTNDESVSVRRLALKIVARGRGPDWSDDDDDPVVEIADASEVLRRALRDEHEEVRRLAIFHLFRRKEWGQDDLTQLLSARDTDRVCSEAILAAALSPQPERFALDEVRLDQPDERPLTSSVLSWATR